VQILVKKDEKKSTNNARKRWNLLAKKLHSKNGQIEHCQSFQNLRLNILQFSKEENEEDSFYKVYSVDKESKFDYKVSISVNLNLMLKSIVMF